MNRIAKFVLLSILFAVVPFLHSQVNPNEIKASNDTGVQLFGVYSGSRENIGLSNGNLNISIPLLSLPGRNGLGVSLSLVYDSKIWSTHSVFYPEIPMVRHSWKYENHGVRIGELGWMLSIPYLTGGDPSYDMYGYLIGCADYIVTLSDGSKHSFPCGTPVIPGPREDGSHIRFERWGLSTTFTATLKDGTKIYFPGLGPAGQITDTNGNYISFVYSSGKVTKIIDTVGREITLEYPTNGVVVKYKDSNGDNQQININTGAVALSPTFTDPQRCGSGCTPEVQIGQPTARNYTLVTSIVFPEDVAGNHTYKFQYNNFGELTKVVYPTGGYTKYEYAKLSHLEADQEEFGQLYTDFREVSAKKVCNAHVDAVTLACSGAEDQTTYTPGNLITSNGSMTVVDPTGTITRYTLTQNQIYYPESAWKVPHELTRKIERGGITYKEVTTTYGTGVPELPMSVLTKLGNVYTKQEFTYYGTDAAPINNLKDKLEYDYGPNPASLPLLQKTHYTYKDSTDYVSANVLDRKTSETIYDASGTPVAQTQYVYDGTTVVSSGTTFRVQAVDEIHRLGVRGNLTAIKKCLDPATCNSALVTNYTIDDIGHVRKVSDFREPGNPNLYKGLTLSYTDSWNSPSNVCPPKDVNGATVESKAFLSSVVNAKNQTVTGTYNSCTGTVASVTDPNAQVSSFTYDSMNRLLQSNLPRGAQTLLDYDEIGGGPFSLSTATKITPTITMLNGATLDYVGRAQQSCLDSDPEGATCTETGYDGIGQVTSKTNPHRTAPLETDGTTTFALDPLGRPTSTTKQDGSIVTNLYQDNCTTATDERGRKRKTCVDGLGRITQVFEDPDAQNFATYYKYSPLGLTCVEQHGNVAGAAYAGCNADSSNDANSDWRIRRFSYDALGRLLTSKNPETGTITYTYPLPGTLCSGDADAVCTRTDARGAKTIYAYDELNRLTGKTYDLTQAAPGVQPTSPVGYTYDSGTNGIGRRTGMTDGSGSTAWTYDQSGNVVTVAKTIGTVTRTFTYGYNLDNSVATITYPSGLLLTYEPEGAGRVIKVYDAAGTYYADAITYWPAGALHTAKLGKTTQFNGIDLLDSYNRRLQPTVLSAASPSQTLLSLTYDFNWGTVQAPINNGTLKTITNNLDANWSRAFTYDALNRVQTAQTPSSANYGVTFTVDPWGNLTNRDPITGKNVVWPLADPATKKNQLSSRTHDLAGNVINDGVGHTYTYDAENRVYATGGVTYTYDGDGERVKKSNGMLYWTGTGTAALLETALDGTATAEYVFFNGKRIARIDRPSNTTHYYLSDHLGSTAKVTSALGEPEEWNELGVYGEPIAGGNTRYLFTGKERDAGGEDFFGARYYGFRMGRFLTPDWANIPAPIPYSTIGEPQSLNLYSYALNNPVTGTDPDGHLTVEKTHGDGGRLSSPSTLWGRLLKFGESFGFPDIAAYQPAPAPTAKAGQGQNPSSQRTPRVYPSNFIGPLQPGDIRGPCFAQLKSRGVRHWAAKLAGGNHTYWYVQDTAGFQWSISGGPWPEKSTPQFLNVWVTPEGAAGTNDAKNGTTVYSTGVSTGECACVAAMIETGGNWPNNQISYSPKDGPNSNTAARVIGEAGGLHPAKPPGAYGWEHTVKP